MCINCLWILRARDRDRDILTRLRLGHQRPVNRGCPDEKYQDVNNNRLTEYPGTPAWTPATSKSRVSVRRLDTRDLLVAGVPISISSKYLYLYLALKVLTNCFSYQILILIFLYFFVVRECQTFNILALLFLFSFVWYYFV